MNGIIRPNGVARQCGAKVLISEPYNNIGAGLPP